MLRQVILTSLLLLGYEQGVGGSDQPSCESALRASLEPWSALTEEVSAEARAQRTAAARATATAVVDSCR